MHPSSALPPVARFLPSTLLEWDGRLAAVVVLQGCNLRCPFCHSAACVPVGRPADEIPWEDVEAELASRADWLDGVVISGGEPTIHAGLPDLLARLRELELPVKLDTNGTNPDVLAALVRDGLVAHIAVDVKAPLAPDEYARAAGMSVFALDKLRDTLDLLKKLPEGSATYELRTTAVPGILGPDEETRLLALAADLSWAGAWFLQAFQPVDCLDPAFEKLPATDPAWLVSVAEKCRRVASGCRVRGESASGGWAAQ